ncbi:MAG: PH domain-containing protein [Alphaproteobacteria bacterium]|jgi:hypothetical protein|nr:PH domain-containing protein [Alphaproteobacteria bacterium]MCB1551520.1 PH domain-containing protein [Alphaproteobacteria bacterium]MCB9984631.1 PH domain-containing protein [Micavibrio sp.]HPQ50905.1 PH domain-containing protein [Alphaproteobacteria bacterium]HRK97974.1 PH domain-containing protein [Alphaproteobacteria bacterium]
MSFIAKHISNHDERIVYIARLHWIYFIKGIFWFCFLTLAGALLNFSFWYGLALFSKHTGYPVLFPDSFAYKDYALFFLMTATGIMTFWIHVLKMIGSEIALTNSRIIYKTGVFFVTVEELELSEIKEERVHHGVLGALLGYGEIHLDSRFVGDISLPAVTNPYKLLKYLHKVKPTAVH